MKFIFTFLFLYFLINVIQGNFLNPYPRFKKYSDNDDPGEPLYLTPLIKEGKIKEAREKAKVTGTGVLNDIESYSGYLTVNKTSAFKSDMFFWYFPAKENKDYAPIILWLQGGPGATSLFGLFTENGPFEISDNGDISLRNYSWHKNHHLIYIDNPVGTGYSLTTSNEGYSKNEIEVGKNLYEAILQLYILFDEFKNLDFWITGESYGGKYVPALAHKIHLEKKHEQIPIKLKGVAIGNGFTDPIHQLHYSEYLYQIGLIDLNSKEMFKKYEKIGFNCIKTHNMSCAFEVFDLLIDGDEQKVGSLFKNLTGFETYFNYLKTKDDKSSENLGKFLQLSSTRKSIHVGNNTFHDLSGEENKVELYLKNDIMSSVSLWVAELLNNNYRVCIYNGQLDIIVAYPLTLNYLQKLKFNGDGFYKNAKRKIWKVDNEIAGYTKDSGNLLEILIRNAGHMAPADQPKWLFDMITRLTYNKGFDSKLIQKNPEVIQLTSQNFK